jgi:hypothetical protein
VNANLAGYRIYWGANSGMYFQAQGSGQSLGNVTTYTLP